MLGIATATNNFQDPKTSSLAFEMAGILMRNGALRPTPNQPKRENLSMDFGDDQFMEPLMPKKSFNTQPLRPAQPVQSTPTQPRQAAPIQSTQLRTAEQMRNQLKQQEQAPIENVEAKEGPGMGETPPDDWLTPKIYKGSTNF
jgi:hypothetical protein